MAASGNKRPGRKVPPAGVAEIPGIVAPLGDASPEPIVPAIELPTPVAASIPPALANTVKPASKPVRVKAPARPVAAPAPVMPEPVVAEAIEQAVEAPAAAVATSAPVAQKAMDDLSTAATEQTQELTGRAVEQVEAAADTITAAVEETAAITHDPASAAQTQQEKTIMDTIQTATDKSQAMFADANDRAKGAMEKGAKFFQEMTEFGKGNVEAVVESSKIAAKGLETMGQDTAAYLKTSFEDATQAMRTLATIKSPTELMKFQADYVRSAFDALVAQTSRGTEASLKLAGEVAQPISNRVAVAAEKIKVAA
ncbi:phasin family protein [Sphingomonas sp. 1P08PE]|uniref:phasin family protein n=1 Tax=Sphingomonas sp. 1P08PE TaxID=554122 RepID=UPI00399F4BBA